LFYAILKTGLRTQVCVRTLVCVSPRALARARVDKALAKISVSIYSTVMVRAMLIRGIMLAVFGTAFYAVPVFAQTIEKPILQTTPQNIIGVYEYIDPISKTAMTEYAYKTNILQKDFNEIETARTETTRVYNLGAGQKEYRVYANLPQFYKDPITTQWYEVDYAKSPTVDFKQAVPMAVHLSPFSFLIRTAHAQTTYYPNTTNGDGWGRSLNAGGATWSTTRSVAGSNASPADTSLWVGFSDHTTNGNYVQIYRTIAIFDTSAIPDTDTIDSATLNIKGISKNSDAGTNLNYNIYSATTVSGSTLQNSDFDISGFGTTAFATAITHTNLSASAYNTWTFNTSGKSAISKTGVSKFGVVLENDITNSAPTHDNDGVSDNDRIEFASADTAGTVSDPYMSITTSAGGGGGETATTTATSTASDLSALSQFYISALLTGIFMLIFTLWIWTRLL